LDFKRAKILQEKIAGKVVKIDRLSYPPKYVLGLDISYGKGKAVACCVIMDFDGLTVHEVRYVVDEVMIPYVPTFLAFRELPFYTYLCYDFRNRNDVVFLVDGHGLAHPRKMGIASHLGVVLNVPSIGVAKKILTGSIIKRGNKEYLRVDENIVGIVLKHKGFSPIYVSIGHNISLETSEKIVRHCLKNHKLPLPIYFAHKYSKRIAQRL